MQPMQQQMRRSGASSSRQQLEADGVVQLPLAQQQATMTPTLLPVAVALPVEERPVLARHHCHLGEHEHEVPSQPEVLLGLVQCPVAVQGADVDPVRLQHVTPKTPKKMRHVHHLPQAAHGRKHPADTVETPAAVWPEVAVAATRASEDTEAVSEVLAPATLQQLRASGCGSATSPSTAPCAHNSCTPRNRWAPPWRTRDVGRKECGEAKQLALT
jgi:hypothetical protein